ncbi:hypothetical protein [Qipengyuania vesicularis]|uniref:hypothetical protein n=1 Tax=Qipengyuania vesicularis TaxID=2867232 RepID=UPI001C87CE05|nr:hypothetical protein [Qipengyuania vesicularis]MBX7527756.1 hypothetical protein [Qipengyuania vesicularis]
MTITALLGASSLYYYLGSYIIVKDKTGLVTEVKISNGITQQKLKELSSGYFVGIQDQQGQLVVKCSDGSELRGLYVGAHYRYRWKVVGDGTCDDIWKLSASSSHSGIRLADDAFAGSDRTLL